MSEIRPDALTPSLSTGEGANTKTAIKDCVLSLFPGKLFKIRFDFANLVGDNAFKVTQIVEDLTFEIDFSAVALTNLIEFIDHIAQIRLIS